MSKQWFDKHTNDPYVKQAIKQGFRSRAAFKLLEVQKKRKIITPSDWVLDLGSAPGAWSQVLVKLASAGKVVACDLLPMQKIPSVTFIQGDFLDPQVQIEIKQCVGLFDVIVSDMAPNLTGQMLTDQANMYELVAMGVLFCQDNLKVGGRLLMKCFAGSMQHEVLQLFKENFSRVKTLKPEASRAESKEIYLIGEGFRL